LLIFIKDNTFLNKLIEELKTNKEYVDDYIWSKNIHVVEVRPEINYSAFLEGEYSKIYTKQQLSKCFLPTADAYKIMTKDPSYFNKYYEFIKKQFGDVKKSSVLEHKEFDIPPCLNQEIMNG